MSQKEMNRMHVGLEESLLNRYAALATDQFSVGVLIVAAVLCCLDKFKLMTAKGKMFTANKTKVDPLVYPERVPELQRMHVYFGTHAKAILELEKAAKKSKTSVSWLVRQACLVCVDSFEKNIPKGKTFKCLGQTVGI